MTRPSERLIDSIDGRQPPGNTWVLTKSRELLAACHLDPPLTMAWRPINPSGASRSVQVRKKVSRSRQSTASIISIDASLS